MALAMAVLGVWILQFMLFRYSTDLPQIFRLTLGALLLGALGWFVGDTIFQALTLSDAAVAATAALPSGGGRPTQRLVISTRKLMRKLTAAQQLGLLAGLVVLAAVAAWVLGPVIAKVPFLWASLPSYAFAAPLAWAAMGRKPFRAGAAHILVVSVGGAALRASTGSGAMLPELLGASAAGAVVIEVFVWLVWRKRGP